MERLTHRLKTGEVIMATECEGKYTKDEWICVLQERLAAYEDTGLTPNECTELAKGYKNGTILVLPCKVGDVVWRLQYVDKGNGTFPVEPVETRFDLLILSEFDRTVFLTREEAEKALEARKYETL